MSDSEVGLDFIIVGASVSGLASAISLKKSGHSVLVLEKQAQLGGAGSGLNGCARICPNGSKILLDWGLLGTETKAKAAGLPGFSFYKYNAGEVSEPDLLGENRWHEELLFEAREVTCNFVSHQDLIRILYDAATRTGEDSSPRVSVLFGAEVMNVDCDSCTVTLRSGQIHTGDAIIGADGARGVVRQTLMQEEDTSLESDIPTGIAVFWCMHLACGEANDLALCIYTPDSSQDGTWTEEAEKKFTDVLGQCDVRLQRLAALAGAATCVQLKEPYTLESWASQSGRVLVLGEAAHPFPVAWGFHPYSVALEDAAFIGKIFSHTRNRDRVPEFFYAFQEHRHVQFRNASLPFLNAGFVREARCSRIRGIDMEYVQAMTLPEGEMQAQRDAGIRANYAAGRNGLEGNFEHMLDDYRTVFGYDAMDDADEWWINWGRFRDTGRTDGPINLSQALISSVTTCVENDGNAEEAEEK
ncbi:hypothetical protein B0H13DRAFT_2679470 [Mycena leptocephala]|nr:hypothetical protein B0H13DRAFT_2679470 [Mycena leptocephala]